MDVPGSSPIVVIDADGDSGLTASVDSKLLSFLPCQGCVILFLSHQFCENCID